ncbi:MAG: DUF4252 domain-containing protein [Gammaproteobacteria bacterium]
MWIRKISGGVVLLGICAGASAQGYFDFGEIPGVSEQPKVDINLNEVLLGFVLNSVGAQNPEAADFLRGLHGVRVRVYETLRNSDQVGDFIDDASGTLEAQGWQRVVYVQDEGSKVRIYLQMTEEEVSGMTVMVVDQSDAIFMNIAGSIEPDKLAALASHFGAGDALGAMTGANFALPGAVAEPASDAP